jgi:Cu/Ag efflux pump CusA
MTACAMTVGMVPMSLALEAGSQLEAPLGRAVIGGLLAATITSLLILPSVFSLVQQHAGTHSPSLDPEDPDSRYASRAKSSESAGGGEQ